MFLNFLISALFLGKEYIKEKSTPVIPASYWNNKKLIQEDKLNPAVFHEQFMKNLRNGKYYLPEPQKERTMRDIIDEYDKKMEKRKQEAKNVVCVHRGNYNGRRKYKEFIPYERDLNYYKVYDEEWKVWLLVKKNSGASQYEYQYIMDKDILDYLKDMGLK